MKAFSHLQQHLAKFFSEREIFQTNVVDKIKTHILWSPTFSRKSCHLRHHVEKYGKSRVVADYMAHARYMVYK